MSWASKESEASGCTVRSVQFAREAGAEQQQQPSGLEIIDVLDFFQQTLMLGGQRLQLPLDDVQ